MVFVILLAIAGVVAIYDSGKKANKIGSFKQDLIFVLGLLAITIAGGILIYVTAETCKTSMICPECKEVYSYEYEYCPEDGTELEWLINVEEEEKP